ncbi:Biosynthetic Aromatic amino acid aminotransferase alpha @ Aspartate aminotransferase [hydrothermal vent metagenome]|uniref:Biosynthetic Aromatic amino acid aminotransferase alpha @ Aspartate aminotransferase n=1 Tax=hydrothermal vent metagenome TaxID=652676 RepID=A0A3B1CLM7_9ZZZZ
MKKPVSEKIEMMMERSSWIRKMFEEGARLKAEMGENNVFDFTLGNPVGEPPEKVETELKKLVNERKPGAHRYMPNAGFVETRSQIAKYVSERSGRNLSANNIVMTTGAGGALNVIIKALCDPADEVVIAAPYFPEYLFYADNHQAKIKVVETDEKFQLMPEEIEKALGAKTRIVLLNSPNNPTGAIYPENALKEIGEILERAAEKYGRPIYLVMDEPYRKLAYDDVIVPDVFNCYQRSIVATSHSKDLNLPGERIGYIAIHPDNEEPDKIFDAMTLANRILGFVNAPALFQRLAASMQDVTPDMSVYKQNRDILYNGLSEAGYDIVKPDGGFYLFPKSPIEDDVKFVETLKKRNVLVVPGKGFGRGGHFRISFCCEPDVCGRALPGFEEAFDDL